MEETDAEMDMWIEIYPTYGNNSKEIKLIVTPFRKLCSRNEKFKDYRVCPGSTRCILSELFCDGVLNCPEMPKDEEAEHCEEKLPPLEKYHNVPLAMIIIVAVLVVIALVAYFIRDIFVICRHFIAKRSEQTPDTRTEERQRNHQTPTTPLERDQRVRMEPEQRGHQRNIQTLRTDQARESPTPTPSSPPAYSDIVSNSPYDPPPSYQSFL